MPERLSAGGHSRYTDSYYSQGALCNAVISVTAGDVKPFPLREYVCHASVILVGREEAHFLAGLTVSHGAFGLLDSSIFVVPTLDCVRPLGGENDIVAVRQGGRFSCFVNGRLVFSVIGTDAPLRLFFQTHGLDLAYRSARVAVPVRRTGGEEGTEEEEEEVF
jgi:hypothetical protein